MTVHLPTYTYTRPGIRKDGDPMHYVLEDGVPVWQTLHHGQARRHCRDLAAKVRYRRRALGLDEAPDDVNDAVVVDFDAMADGAGEIPPAWDPERWEVAS